MDFCEICVYGKQKRVSFVKSGKEKKDEKLELVHTDVWGPAQVSSLGGSHYYVTFIDDATRKVQIYFLRQKSDVFQIFKKWKCLVENEIGKRENVSDLIMVVSIAIMNFKIIAPPMVMVFIDRKFQGLHGKIDWLNACT